MEQALQIFNYKDHEVRTVIIDGEIWFVIADACKVLEIKNVSQATDRLDQDGVCLTEVIDSLGRKQKAAVANEPNLYRLIFRSDKSQAKAFQDWVYKEVLPSIRKTGTYTHPLLIRLQQEQAFQIPSGYWTIFGEVCTHLEDINTLPDIERIWQKQLRAWGFDISLMKSGDTSIYPNKWLPEFKYWFHNFYLKQMAIAPKKEQ
jgi:prophage antirepressor-like protein